MTQRPPKPPLEPPRLETLRPRDERMGRGPGPSRPPRSDIDFEPDLFAEGVRPEPSRRPPLPHPREPYERPAEPTLGYPEPTSSHEPQTRTARPRPAPQQPMGPRPAPPYRAGSRPAAPLRDDLLEEPRRGGWMRVGVITLAGIGACAAGLVVAGPYLVPVGLVRDELVRVVKARTGRDLVIGGATSLSFWPSLAVSIADVSLSGPPGVGGAGAGGAPPLLRSRRIAVKADLLALLQRRIAIDEVVISEPVFELRIDAQGRRNWDFAALSSAPPRLQYAQARPAGQMRDTMPTELEDFLRNSNQGTGTPAAAPRGSVSRVQVAAADVSIDQIGIEHGIVRYRDARSGQAEEVTALDARIAAHAIGAALAAGASGGAAGSATSGGPASAKGSFALRGETVEFDARVANVKALIDDKPARVTATLASPRGKSRFDGTWTVQSGQIDGAVNFETSSLRGLAGWLGAALPGGGGLGPVSLKADVKGNPRSLALDNAELAVDGTTATGTVGVELGGVRPFVKASLNVGRLDLNPYFGGPDASVAGAAAARPSAKPPAANARPSIEDLLRAPGERATGERATGGSAARVKGSLQSTAWSDEPFKTAGFSTFDGDARITLGGLVYRDIKIGSSQVALALKSGSFRASVEDMRLYGGQGRGTLAIDTTPAIPTMGAVLALDGVSGAPLLKDAAGFEWISGKTRLNIAVGGQGASQQAMMDSLEGRADVTFADGAISGFDIAQTLRNLGQGRFGALAPRPGDKTEFSEAGASWQIKAGEAQSKDIHLASPQLRVTGTGSVSIARRQIDTTLRPKLASATSPSPDGAAAEPAGIEVPIRIKGSWERPQIGPDIDAVMHDPNKVIDTVKQVAKQLQGKNGGQLGQALGKLLGHGNAPPPAGNGDAGTSGNEAGTSGGLQALEQLLKK